MTNAEKIKARILEMGLTQAELAKKIGVATPTICQKINNHRPFTLSEAEQVAYILGIDNTEFGSYFFAK